MLLHELMESYREKDRHLCVEVFLEGRPVDYYRNTEMLGPVVLNRPVLEVKQKEYNKHEDLAIVSLD